MGVIRRNDHFVSYSAADWRGAAGDADPFVIDGLVAQGVTLVYGQSEAGKSMFTAGVVVATVSGQEKFLARDVQYRPQWHAGLLTGDFRDAPRWCERLERALTREQMRQITVYDPTRVGMPFDEGWERLAEDVKADGVMQACDKAETISIGFIEDKAS